MFKKIGASVTALLMAASPLAAVETFAVAGRNFDTATRLELNTERTDNTASSGEDDFYRISLEEAGVVTIDFSHGYVDDPNDYWYIYVYDFEHNQITDKAFAGSETGTVSICDLGLDKGDYYIQVQGSSSRWSNVDYKLKANFTASDKWEKELNNRFDSATAIPVNTEISGTIDDDGEDDYYRINLAKAGVVKIDFSHEYVDDPKEYWYIYVYDFEHNQITDKAFAGSEKGTVSICDLGLDKGDYYIQVHGSSSRWSDVDYKLKANFTASDKWEKELNNKFETATAIPVNTEISGTIDDDGEDDFYRINLAKAGMVKIDFSHEYVDDPKEYWYIYVYDFEHNQITDKAFYGNEKGKASICELGLDKGNYYIQVHGSSSRWSDVDYKLKANFTASDAWEKELNNKFETATAVSLNKNYNGTIYDSNEVDVYRFSLNKQQQITFGFKHGNADVPDNTWLMRVYDFSNNMLAETGFKGNKTKSDYSTSLNLPKGEYYVAVRSSSKHSELPYILRIRDPKDKEGIGGDIMTGDANGDEQINVSDIAVIASFIKGIKALDTDGQSAADVNADSKINVTDIAMIASHIKGIKALPQ